MQNIPPMNLSGDGWFTLLHTDNSMCDRCAASPSELTHLTHLTQPQSPISVGPSTQSLTNLFVRKDMTVFFDDL